jgi:hypothetical protein
MTSQTEAVTVPTGLTECISEWWDGGGSDLDTQKDTSARYTRLAAASLSLLLFVGFLVGQVAQLRGLSTATVVFFGFLGLGSAPLQFSKRIYGFRFITLTVGIGISIVLLTGFSLVEIPAWRAGIPLFWLMADAAALVHLNTLRKDFAAPRQAFPSPLWTPPARDRTLAGVVTLTVAGVVLSLGSALTDLHLVPGKGGLLTSISPAWYIGIAFLLVAILLAWNTSPTTVAVPIIMLAAIVTVTPSIVYDLPRYDWTQKHVGVTLYFLQHGSVNTHIDIYQSWPGFFAGIAWLCHAANVNYVGFNYVEEIARFWSPAVIVIGMLVIRSIGRTLGFSDRNAWLSALLFVIGDTVAQSYYSPQSIAYVAALIFIAIAIRQHSQPRGASVFEWLLLVALSCALAVTHQLTPFVLAGALLVLAIFGLLRSRLFPLVALVPAAFWAAIHHSQVRHYFNVADIGKVGANLKTPNSALHYHYGITVYLSDAGQILAPGLIGLLALIVLFNRRDRLAWALALCAGSPVVLLLVHYGNEDDLRATLFALPWLALLVGYGEWRIGLFRRLALYVALPIITAGFIVSDTGLDNIYVVRPGDLAVIRLYENYAPKDSILMAVGSRSYIPIKSSPRYPDVNYQQYLIPTSIGTPGHSVTSVIVQFTDFVEAYQLQEHRSRLKVSDFYVATNQQAAAQLSTDGVLTRRQYNQFARGLATSSAWRVLKQTDTGTLYGFVPPPAFHLVTPPAHRAG